MPKTLYDNLNKILSDAFFRIRSETEDRRNGVIYRVDDKVEKLMRAYFKRDNEVFKNAILGNQTLVNNVDLIIRHYREQVELEDIEVRVKDTTKLLDLSPIFRYDNLTLAQIIERTQDDFETRKNGIVHRTTNKIEYRVKNKSVGSEAISAKNDYNAVLDRARNLQSYISKYKEAIEEIKD